MIIQRILVTNHFIIIPSFFKTRKKASEKNNAPKLFVKNQKPKGARHKGIKFVRNLEVN